MATNHTCSRFTDSKGRDFLVLKTPASNLKLVNLRKEYGNTIKLSDTNYYGMNGSFFNSDESGQRYPALLNIAYQDGKTVGCGILIPDYSKNDGEVNIDGTSLVYWTGSVLNCVSNVLDSGNASVPKGTNSWAQGGYGLYLCDSQWQTKYEAERNASVYPVGGGSARTGILINKNTRYVHLFACRILTTAVFDLRNAMMEYAGITQGGSPGNWAAIMTDGGSSVQLRGEGYSETFVAPRKLVQIIALKNKT